MSDSLKPGNSYTLTKKVEPADTAQALGSGGVNVLGTPFLVALMERASRMLAADALETGKTTVGTSVNIRHLAATPVGMEVKITATLTEIDGRKLEYSVEAWDEKEKIGEGTHERFIVDTAKFTEKAAAKSVCTQGASSSLRGRSLLTLKDFSKDEILYLIELSAELKSKKKRGVYEKRLLNKNIALIFEKPSTRTRCAFTVAAIDEGAHPEYLGVNDIQLGHKETVEDTARVLGRMFDGIEFRGFSQKTAELLAEYSGVPVWNGLTDEDHPTQALADLLTVKEVFGKLEGIPFVFIGDGRNNVANALMIAASKVGMDFTVCAPKELAPDSALVSQCMEYAKDSGGSVAVTDDPQKAVANALVVYTDVWTSMGEEEKSKEREKLLAPYQVNSELMKNAAGDAIFMHCLPAVRGKEVTEEVFESPQSVVFDEAENRMHTIKAVMVATLGAE